MSKRIFKYIGEKNINKLRECCEEKDNVNCVNNNSNSPLMVACLDGYSQGVQLLLNKDADVNYENMKGDTALIWAADHDRDECITLLLEKKANINHQNHRGETALTRATFRNSFNAVDVLTSNSDCDKTLKNKWGETALDIANDKNLIQCKNLLIERQRNE